jgi:hypothetical protein
VGRPHKAGDDEFISDEYQIAQNAAGRPVNRIFTMR